MTTDENTNNPVDIQDLDNKLDALLKEAENFSAEVDTNIDETRKSMTEIENDVNTSVNNLNQIYTDLEKIEANAVTEFEALEKEQG